MIRFDRIHARNLGVLRDVEVDLSAIPGTLVAVVGANGSGKSTFLGLLAAALYRDAPTRGSLVDLARSRDASLEVSFVNSAPWTVRHIVDGVGKKSEAAAFDAAGAPATDSGKVRAFDAWARSVLPAPEVFLASVFAAQGSRGFLGLSASERKGVLLRVLGVERLERLAEEARERLRAAKARLDVVRGQIGEVEGAADVAGAETWLKVGEARGDEARAAVAAARARLAEEERRVTEHEASWSAEQARAASQAEAEKALADARARKADLERRIANNREILARAAEIRGAAARVAEIDRELAAVEAEMRRHDVDGAARSKALVAATNRRDAAARRERDAGAAARSESDRASTLEREVTEARAALDVDGPERDRLAALITTGEAEIAKLRGQHVAGLDERVYALRLAHSEIVDNADKQGTWEDHATFATEQATFAIAVDDHAARVAKEAPERLAAAEKAVAAHRADLALVEARIRRAERHAGRADEVGAALRRHDEATQAMREARVERETAEREIAEIAAADEELGSRLADLRERRTGLTTEREALAKAARDLSHLDAAEARIGELLPQVDAATAAAGEALARIAQIGPPAPVTAPDRRALDAARVAVVEAEGTLEAFTVEQGAKQRDVESARAAAARLAELSAQRQALDADVADWTRLAEDLGRDGLQAAEIDAAGPELTELVNDLLRTCVGPRWTVTVDTQRLSSDGKRTLEGLEVRVLDVERGREAPAETLSGGELVLVGEAVSLALTMLACRRAGVRGATLIRDESGAALDVGAARSYVAMLRRACTLVGARQCLFVSHSQEVVDMADARIVLDEGRAVVS